VLISQALLKLAAVFTKVIESQGLGEALRNLNCSRRGGYCCRTNGHTWECLRSYEDGDEDEGGIH